MVIMECLRCGTCCTAPDISTLGKPLGVRCRNLDDECLCTIYKERPAVCRRYQPDDLCLEITAPTLSERTARYLEIYGLQQ